MSWLTNTTDPGPGTPAEMDAALHAVKYSNSSDNPSTSTRTVTFTVNGVPLTIKGQFPACPCRVVFYDVNYTPNKTTVVRPTNPYTWHWDSIVVR